ncbi:hypothetical protein [Pseudoalteromonas sp. Ps84H-4]|uniref:hypothetical protein n=1 Tax=Pseudoalteromonas sp. Ps84H-4 TaxID=2954502 RepID=UPI0020980A04|nr:hypothetical protein [Pseudoalteromonas sp. Ps84H-4]MCO7249854.1 hypothetical protein [Pseudoalteromonas sp. Ps84H-4]
MDYVQPGRIFSRHKIPIITLFVLVIAAGLITVQYEYSLREQLFERTQIKMQREPRIQIISAPLMVKR